MKRLWLLGFSVLLMVPMAAQARAAHAPAAAKGDVCGYRYAIWPALQESSDFVNQAVSGRLDDFHANEISNYLLFKFAAIATDYGSPQGWQKISNIEVRVLVRVYGLIALGTDKGDTSFVSFETTRARTSQAHLWAAANALCSWKGKAATSAGVLSAYGYRSGDTATVRIPARWKARGYFDCPPSSYGSPSTDSGNFIVYVRGGAYDGQTAFNDLDTSGAHSVTFSRGGAYSFRVVTTCAWHLQVTRA